MLNANRLLPAPPLLTSLYAASLVAFLPILADLLLDVGWMTATSHWMGPYALLPFRFCLAVFIAQVVMGRRPAQRWGMVFFFAMGAVGALIYLAMNWSEFYKQDGPHQFSHLFLSVLLPTSIAFYLAANDSVIEFYRDTGDDETLIDIAEIKNCYDNVYLCQVAAYFDMKRCENARGVQAK